MLEGKMDELLGAIQLHFDSYREFCRRRDHKDSKVEGGYVSLFQADDEVFYLITVVGEVEPEEAKRLFEEVQEQPRRLKANPSHLTSYESREPRTNKKGGAIRTDLNEMVTFVGASMTEHGCETVVLAALVEIEDLTLKAAVCAARESSNLVFMNYMLSLGR